MNIDKHKLLMLQLLKDIYSDPALAAHLGFKGGTALMLFHDLPRFSVDLDFNLRNIGKTEAVYQKIKTKLLQYGTIRDEAVKQFGMIQVLDYGEGERNLKIEISSREFADSYELRDYLGISINVMVLEDMFSHKLAALLDRSTLTNRDVFDCWFLMNKRTMLNGKILSQRLNCPLAEYLEQCKERISGIKSNRILNGLGELMDPKLKNWVRQNLIREFTIQADFYKNLNLVK